MPIEPTPLLLAAIFAITSSAWWRPPAGTSWQIVLSHVLTPPYFPSSNNSSVTALDGDLFDNAANGTWSTVKAAGYKIICYFSAGSYENWRPDAADFHDADLGDPLEGWPGERWLNTNSQNVRDILGRRLDLAVKQGRDAVDPDNIDAYDNDGGGLNVTTFDAIAYVHFLSQKVHQRNLAMGLKNGGAILLKVLNATDFEVNEQCLQYDECETFQPFIKTGKPVFEIEYTKKDSDRPSPDSQAVQKVCTAPSRQGFSTLVKHTNLDEWADICNTTVATRNVTTVPVSTSVAVRQVPSVLGLDGQVAVVALMVLFFIPSL